MGIMLGIMMARPAASFLAAASSWRVAVNAGADSTGRLMEHLRALEETRGALLKRMPNSLSARFDLACAQSSLPDAIIAALLGVSSDEMWDIRNRGVIPAGVLPRVRAFADQVKSTSQDGTDQGSGEGDR